jgi:hypothetical protein
MFLRAQEAGLTNVTWPEAFTIPHSLLACANEVIEYQTTVAMPARNQTKALCGS